MKSDWARGASRLGLGLAVVAAGCTGHPAPSAGTDAVVQPDSAVWTEQTAWRLSMDPIVQIQGSTEFAEESPLDPVRVFRLSDGRYVVADGDQNGWDALLLFSARGKFIKQIGREGQGPGEFSQLLIWGGSYRGDSIAAYDSVDRTVEIFTPDGQFARAIKLPPSSRKERPPRGTWSAAEFFIGPLADGRLLSFDESVVAVPGQPGPVYYEPDLHMYDANGQKLGKLAALPTWGQWWDGKQAVDYLFQPMPITIVGQEVWYHANGLDFTIQVFDSEGKLLRTLRRPYTRVPVTPEDREALIRYRVESVRRSPVEGGSAMAERVEASLRNQARFAEFRPPYTSLIEDSERNLWIEHYRWIVPDDAGPGRRPTRWTVFSPDGLFLGEIETPASFMVSSITTDQVLGVWQDEFDVQHVRIYSLIKPGN